MTHDEDTLAKELQKTAFTPPNTSPKPTMAPIIQCVVETGHPYDEATCELAIFNMLDAYSYD